MELTECGQLLFLDEHLGFFVELHPNDEFVDIFNWSMEADGSLIIKGIQRYHYEDDELMEPEISELNARNLFFKLEVEKIFTGKNIDVLRFSDPAFLGEDKFGLVTRDISLNQRWQKYICLLSS
jgi:hypothetical protein